MAQVKATYLHTSGQQVNMGDTDTLRGELDPTNPSDLTNMRYTNAEDLRVANEAQVANDNLEIRINDEIARLDQEDVDINARIDQEILDRIAGDDAIMDLLNEGGPGSTNKYVERTGDDMTGNLTLGTTFISLNATDGSASLAEGKATITADGVGNFSNTVGTSNALTISNSTGSADNAVITADGNFDCAQGEIHLAKTAGLTLDDGVLDIYKKVNTDTTKLLTLQSDVGSTKAEVAHVAANGDATFVGEVIADKVDGGVYAV